MINQIKSEELSYDISRIPAVRDAMMSEHGAQWDKLLEAAAILMDDDIREALHSEWDDSRSECDFLAVYCARHEARFGTRFDF
jgi:hypothetical protein